MGDSFIAFFTGMAAELVLGIIVAAVLAAISNRIEGGRE